MRTRRESVATCLSCQFFFGLRTISRLFQRQRNRSMVPETTSVHFPASATSKDVLAATRNITAENKAADNTPLYSPDGKYIAYRAQQRAGYESDRFRLLLYDRKTGKKADLSDGEDPFDLWVDSFAWSPDSKRIYLTAANTGES